jgi:hypothetical protein
VQCLSIIIKNQTNFCIDIIFEDVPNEGSEDEWEQIYMYCMKKSHSKIQEGKSPPKGKFNIIEEDIEDYFKQLEGDA